MNKVIRTIKSIFNNNLNIKIENFKKISGSLLVSANSNLQSITIIFSLSIFASSCKTSTGTNATTLDLVNPTTKTISFWKGIIQFGKEGSEPITKTTAHDSQGNIYVAGTILGKGLDGLPMISGKDSFIRKYSSTGVLQWTKKYGPVDQFGWTDMGQKAISIDSKDNIYFVFSSSGSIDPSVTKIGNLCDAYIVKLTKDGKQIFVKNFSPAPDGDAMATGVVVDSLGNIIIIGIVDGGNFEGKLTWGPQDAFILKLNKDTGSKIWVKQISPVGTSIDVTGIAIDSNNNIFIVGGLLNATFTGISGLAIKFDSSGNEIWRNIQPATRINDIVSYTSVIIDKLGAAYVTGIANNSFNGHPMIGATDSFLYRINPNGMNAWIKSYGNNASTNLYFSSIVSDGTSLYLAGSTDGPFQKLSLFGNTDSFLMRVDPAFGEFRWIRQIYETEVNLSTLDIQWDASTKAYSLFLVGDTRTQLGDNLQAGLIDNWIAKFDSKGTQY